MALLELEKLRKDINILFGYVRCLMNKDAETSLLSATEWSPNHSVALGNPYLKDSLVWFNKNIYKSLTDNNIYPPTNTTYWLSLGPGHLLLEEQADWNSTTGRTFIKNKPTSTSDFTNDGQDGSSSYATLEDLNNVIPPSQGLDETLAVGNNAPDKSANIGELGLWDDFDAPTTTPGFAKIYADKGRFYFKDKAGAILAYIRNVGVNFIVGVYSFDVKVPNVITGGRTATFQDASGTVAYLSDNLVANAWSPFYLYSTGNPYLPGTRVYYLGNIYQAILESGNEEIDYTLPTDPVYWELIGPGSLLEQGSGFTPYRYFNPNLSTVTSSSGETELIKVTIPANSFKISDKFYFKLAFYKMGSVNAATVRVKLSTSSTMPTGATNQIAIASIGGTSAYTPVERTMAITNDSELIGFNFSVVSLNDLAANTAFPTMTEFDVTQTQYFYVSVTPAASTTDVTKLQYVSINNF